MKDLLKQKVCLVTGATRGIGRAIAHTLAEQGAEVFGTATTEEGADAITGYFDEAGFHGQGCRLDVTDGNGVADLIAMISEKAAPPQILVNNAGITRDNLLLRMKESEWDEIMDTNLKSAFTLSKACMQGMIRARHGRIVNISSVAGVTGNTGQSNYAAAKAGLIGFSKSLAREVASRNITVNIIAPGFIETDMTHALAGDRRDSIIKNIPLGRLGSAADIAAAVLFLVSDMGAYITGETLHVNGGMFMS